MDEIPCGKSLKSVDPVELRRARKFRDLPDAENFIEYRYARNFLDDPKNSESMKRPLAETIASVHKMSRAQASFPASLIAESGKTKEVWEALILIAQDLLREGKPLPPELAEWAADVLADLSVKKKEKRRPRPRKDPRRQLPRNLLLCALVDQLVYLFDLNAERSRGAPPVTACDVVAAAIYRSYKAVEGIWERRDPVLEPLFSSWDKQTYLKKFLYPH